MQCTIFYFIFYRSSFSIEKENIGSCLGFSFVTTNWFPVIFLLKGPFALWLQVVCARVLQRRTGFMEFQLKTCPSLSCSALICTFYFLLRYWWGKQSVKQPKLDLSCLDPNESTENWALSLLSVNVLIIQYRQWEMCVINYHVHSTVT